MEKGYLHGISTDILLLDNKGYTKNENAGYINNIYHSSE